MGCKQETTLIAPPTITWHRLDKVKWLFGSNTEGVFRFLDAESLGTALELSVVVVNRRAGFGLSDGVDDLPLRESRPLHASAPSAKNRRSR
jgi:hypothetical protein